MTNRMTSPPDARKVIVGVDTHKHVHVAVAIDTWGIRLGDQSFVADSGGYQALITWAETHGRLEAFGIGCFRHQLLLPRPYLVLTKPLRLDIQCQRGASVKIGWKYLDD